MDSKRLIILTKSLAKKEKILEEKLLAHFADVASANGQPLNDKRNGRATSNRWERQENSIRRQHEEIEKTKNAINCEENKIAGVEWAQEILPHCIVDLINNGKLIQWRKHPTIFFVPGVEDARIGWDQKKKIIYHKYTDKIQDKESYKKFAAIYNYLQNLLK